MVEDEYQIESEDLAVSPICYHCAYYFGPSTYGYCRRYEMWVRTDKSCMSFEVNRNEW